ncbi:hypothetical protein Moror_11063 [Moniliophthora roreri MCA 2997]|uniref:Uncharacterized protein n=2 Tax=Moniliophthora roreri TaxID=221103 RepID=V2WV30_MONRO|nr:hypothetical protein Moror_11063 [Moniliophthora roreri MCA 2997]
MTTVTATTASTIADLSFKPIIPRQYSLLYQVVAEIHRDSQNRTPYEYEPVPRSGAHSVPPEDDEFNENVMRNYFLASYYAKAVNRPISRYDWDADHDEIVVPSGGSKRETHTSWSYWQNRYY